MASSRPRVGYLGPEGTFSEEALLGSAVAEAIEPIPLGSIGETVTALREGEVGFSIVPIENSLEGSIGVTLDLLVSEPRDVEIVGEALLRVSHSLIASGPVELEQIDTVITHPQVPGQCASFLRSELARARVLPSSSTAEAVRSVVAAGEPSSVAIGTLLAAQIYGGTVIREGIEDRGDNETRFVWLGRADGAGGAGAPPLRVQAGGESKTSLVFWGPGADSPGWLLRCLDEFARRGINLTKIESRTRRERLGSYMFFVDLEGHVADGAVGDAVGGLSSLCQEVRVLGSYPAAAPAARTP
ncbi:MAG TPA: prephenate dehydratase [Solirubrobacteraceae bacterium]